MIITESSISKNEDKETIKPAWMAIYALALGVAGLITSEFLPVSLLTPMATDLHVTEGIAGQAISITAVIAMIASLSITIVTKNLDRRWVMLSFSLLQIFSNILVAFAPNFMVLVTGRILLGIAIGGFWAMSAAIAMRLVPGRFIAKALSLIFGAVSVATVVAAPLGSYLGGVMSWRYVFLFAAALGVLSLIMQALTLPSMPSEKPTNLQTLLLVLKRPRVKSGMLSTLLIFAGYATFFTYLRPFLEKTSGANVNVLSTVLLGFGAANLAGTSMARHVLEKSLKISLILAPLVMGVTVALLVLFGEHLAVAAGLVALWGMTFGVVQVGWPTWLTKTIPDEAESGGGIQVAVVQLAITVGAATGGLIFDLSNANGVFVLSSIISVIAALAAAFSFRSGSGGTRSGIKVGI